jgi:hypothetical protein
MTSIDRLSVERDAAQRRRRFVVRKQRRSGEDLRRGLQRLRRTPVVALGDEPAIVRAEHRHPAVRLDGARHADRFAGAGLQVSW